MASDVAQPEVINTMLPNDAPNISSDHDQSLANSENGNSFDNTAALSKTQLNIDSSGPTPIEDVAPGIAGVADFIPKSLSTSHPTPPPDEPIATSEVSQDTKMTMSVDEGAAPNSEAKPDAIPLSSSTETTLVRPREEDGDDYEEPTAKRSKVDSDSSQDAAMSNVSPPDVTGATRSEASAENAAVADVPATSETPAEIVTSVQPPVDVPTGTDKVAPVENGEVIHPKPAEAGAKAEADAVVAEPSVKQNTESQSFGQLATTSASQPASGPPKPSYSKAPLTPAQARFLTEKMKNLKKTKNSLSFLLPVDYKALGILNYPDVVTSPMDLSTMEGKLKSGQYAAVQGFANDFDLIISNTLRFNGQAHPVTQAGYAMEAYFRKMMETVPSADQATLPKTQLKKASPHGPGQAQRRESRSAAQQTIPQAATSSGNSAAATTAGEAFALQPDGTPQIRRDSTINRPARTIKPPPARELTYSKPKRKEHQMELKFCEHILNELRSPKYGQFNHVFLAPVDPVALNIPHYRQIVKNPMDLSTMAQKLKQGQYGKAAEFRKDFELMVANCLAFNPAGNVVRDIGVRFQREFEVLWKNKDKWERSRKAEIQRGASASADDESGDDEEEEEEEIEEGVPDPNTIRSMQKQLAEMQSALAVALGKQSKQKKSKSKVKSTTKKTAPVPGPKQKAAAKPKLPKKARQVTYEEKQEISEAVGKMTEKQVGQLTDIITSNCKNFQDQEEMELEIDDLPNDVQSMLLKFVRGIFGNPNRGARAISPDDAAAVDDDDFEPTERGGRKGGSAAKRKKHKPMGKKEQQDAINNLQKQLTQFVGPGTSASQSPSSYGAVQEETSGDEDSEESEEE